MRRLVPLLPWAVLGVGCATSAEDRALARAREVVESSRARTGDLQLSCDPPDAEVVLDGVPQGVCTDFSGTPAGLKVGEGMHRVEVKKEGFQPYLTYLSPSGARAALQITLRPLKTNEGSAP